MSGLLIFNLLTGLDGPRTITCPKCPQKENKKNEKIESHYRGPGPGQENQQKENKKPEPPEQKQETQQKENKIAWLRRPLARGKKLFGASPGDSDIGTGKGSERNYSV